MTTVPLVVTEEHHESLLVWAYALERGWMPSYGNTLLHVDEHADWALPRVDRPLPAAPMSPAETSALVYGELDIGNFLWIAVYQRLFDRVCWLRRLRRSTSIERSRRLFVCAETHADWRLITGRCLPDGSIPDVLRDGAHAVRYDLLEPETSIELDGPMVLSIDLDYFGSHLSPNHPSHRIEVTADELRAYREDPYHFLRISPGGRITPIVEDGRCFLVFNRRRASGSVVDRDTALAAIEQLDRVLAEIAVAPRLITISRSVRSGYTPPELAAELESKLIECLSSRYDVESIELEMIWCAADHRGLRRAVEEEVP